MNTQLINLTQYLSLNQTFHWNMLILLGLALFMGTMGGRIFQKLKIPQVVGYLIIGIIIGRTGFNIINKNILNLLTPFNYFALGIIGFMIGGELKRDSIVKYGKQFLYILFSEGIFAFIIVSIFISIATFLLFNDIKIAISLGLLLGAISSATAPAATTDIFWEYKTKGPLTRTVMGIVAMDDGLALMLFAIASSVAGLLLGNAESGVLISIIKTFIDIILSLIVGSIFGILLSFFVKTHYNNDKNLVLALGMVLINVGVCLSFGLDMILSAMAMGLIITNFSPKKSKYIFNIIGEIAPPVYVLFFVFVGASLYIKNINKIILILSFLYLLGRTAGKMSGAFLGAKISKAPNTVRKYLPLCLFSQAGVAIGLSILASHKFDNNIGSLIVTIITFSTFFVQLIGPIFVKIAINKSGEAGLNITIEDLFNKVKVKDIMDTSIPLIKETDDIKTILNIFTNSDYLFFPVVDNEKKIKGIISVDIIKELFLKNELSHFLLAHDIMQGVKFTANKDDSVKDIKDIMDKYLLDCIPVVENDTIIGFIEYRQLKYLITKRIKDIQKQAYQLENRDATLKD